MGQWDDQAYWFTDFKGVMLNVIFSVSVFCPIKIRYGIAPLNFHNLLTTWMEKTKKDMYITTFWSVQIKPLLVCFILHIYCILESFLKIFLYLCWNTTNKQQTRNIKCTNSFFNMKSLMAFTQWEILTLPIFAADINQIVQ